MAEIDSPDCERSLGVETAVLMAPDGMNRIDQKSFSLMNEQLIAIGPNELYNEHGEA